MYRSDVGFLRLEIFDLSDCGAAALHERRLFAAEASLSQTCLGVEMSHSSARMTWLMPIRWSSTTLARW